MFESKCSNCGYSVDPNRNYECPKCGYKFWRSRKYFETNLKNNPIPKEDRNEIKDTKEIVKISQQNKKHSPNIIFRKVVVFIFLYIPSYSIAIGLVILAEILFSSGGTKSSMPLLSNLSWLIALLIDSLFYIFLVDGKFEKKIVYKNVNKTFQKIHCSKCGKNIDDDSNYCIYCGSKI